MHKNCLVKVISEKHKIPANKILEQFVKFGVRFDGLRVQFKKALQAAEALKISLDGIFVSLNPNGVYHASFDCGLPISLFKPTDNDWIGEPISTTNYLLGAGLAGGGAVLGGLLGKSKSKKVHIPPQVTKSMNKLMALAREAASATAPKREIAALSELEKVSIELAGEFVKSDLDPLLMTSISETLKTATEPIDVTKVPELAALIKRTEEFGQGEANRLAQAIQIRGGSGSTGGRNVLGQKLEDIQTNILATLAPYAQSLRQMKEGAVGRLADLSSQVTGEKLGRVQVAGEAGGLMRNIEQNIYNALFEQEQGTQRLRYEVAPNIYGKILGGAPPGTITGGQPSTFSQVAPVIGQIASAYINRPRTPAQPVAYPTAFSTTGLDTYTQNFPASSFVTPG